MIDSPAKIGYNTLVIKYGYCLAQQTKVVSSSRFCARVFLLENLWCL